MGIVTRVANWVRSHGTVGMRMKLLKATRDEKKLLKFLLDNNPKVRDAANAKISLIDAAASSRQKPVSHKTDSGKTTAPIPLTSTGSENKREEESPVIATVATQAVPQGRADSMEELIGKQVSQLHYLSEPTTVARALWEIVNPWKLDSLRLKLERAKGSKDLSLILKSETELLQALLTKTRETFVPHPEEYDLSGVVKNKRANCVGYVQLLCILGNSLGISISPIEVADLYSQKPMGPYGHVAVLASLSNGEVIMCDLLQLPNNSSRPFRLQEHCREDGVYYLVKDGLASLDIHRRFRIAHGSDGLSAQVYFNRGQRSKTAEMYRTLNSAVFGSSPSKPAGMSFPPMERLRAFDPIADIKQAIENSLRAIKLDPKFITAYLGIAQQYVVLKDYASAIRHLDKAIQSDPKNHKAFLMRGVAYMATGRAEKATEDFEAATRLDSSGLSRASILKLQVLMRMLPGQGGQ